MVRIEMLNHLMRRVLFTSICFLSALFIVMALVTETHAQEITDLTVDENSIGQQDEYIEPAFIALAKMYWAIGKLDLADDDMIDTFLRVTECELYNQFYYNDFEWANLREATRESIRNSMNQFPTKFEIMIPVALDRYDMDESEFPILAESQIDNLRRLDLRYTQPFSSVCGSREEFEGFPRNIITIFNVPFTLTSIPVRPDIARLYIDETSRLFEGLSDRHKRSAYERMAYVRLKISVTRYNETVRSNAGDLRAVVYATIDGVEVYADRQATKPLYEQDMKLERTRRYRRSRGED